MSGIKVDPSQGSGSVEKSSTVSGKIMQRSRSNDFTSTTSATSKNTLSTLLTDENISRDQEKITKGSMNRSKLTPKLVKSLSMPNIKIDIKNIQIESKLIVDNKPKEKSFDINNSKEKDEILNIGKNEAKLEDIIFGNSASSKHFETFTKKSLCNENINFLKELRTEVLKVDCNFESLNKNILEKFVGDGSKSQINIDSETENIIKDAVKSKDLGKLIKGLDQANKEIFALVKIDTKPKFEKELISIDNQLKKFIISTNPPQKQISDIEKNISALSNKTDTESQIKVEKLHNMKKSVMDKYLPNLDINNSKNLSESFAKFKEITVTKSSLTSKPSILRGDINTVYKSFDNLIKASQKSPPDEMGKLKALFSLEHEVKTFIKNNPNSSKIEVLESFSEKIAPLTKINHVTNEQAKIDNPSIKSDIQQPSKLVEAHSPIKYSKDGELIIPDNISMVVEKPGAKGSINQDISLKDTNGTDVTFLKGEKCVVVEKDSKLYIQKIERKKDSKKGDLDEFQVQPTLIPIKDQKLIKAGNQSFTKTTEPLFPKEISLKDIKQGAIGDCYLIAGIYSIAAKDPSAIHNMIKDNKDGTVTVKLFENNKLTNKLEPKFVTFEKSTLNTNEHAEDSLWVQMLEKGYAIHKGSYDKIGEGGHSNDVFEAFTGVPSDKKNILLSSMIDFKSNISPQYKTTDENALKIRENLENAVGTPLTKNQEKALENISNGNYSDNHQLKEILVRDFGLDVNNKDMSIKNNIIRLVSNPEFLPFSSFIDQSKVFAEIKFKSSPTFEDAKKVIDELKEKFKSTEQFKGYPVSDFIGKLETYAKENFKKANEYNPSENKIFNDLKSSLDSGKFVAIGTKKDIGISQGKGHSGGESKVDGLAGQHAYAVLDTVEMNGKKFVKVGNPWGNEFSRDYMMKDGKLVSKEFSKKDYSYLPKSENKVGAGIGANESWIELKDLTKTFEDIYSQH